MFLWPVRGRSRRIWGTVGAFRAAYASTSTVSTIFDVELKAAQRDRAAYLLNPSENDPLHVEVASRVVERVQDCTRRFRRALILGGAGSSVLREILRTSAGAELDSVVVADHSRAMLARCRAQLQQMVDLKGPGESKEPDTSNRLDCPEREHAGIGMETKRIAGRDIKATFHWMDPSDKQERIGYQHGDPEDKFDLVVSCLHLHWVNDIPGVMTQCKELMSPDGFFLGAMLGGETLQEMRIACTLAQQERKGGVAPRTSPAVHVRDAGNLLTRAGFQLPAVDVDDIVVNYEDPFAVVEHLRSMGEQSSLRMRSPLSKDVALAASAVYTTMFGEKGEQGAPNDQTHVPASYQIVYMSGWSPSNDQAKPRQRGSATVSFQDLESHFKASE